MLVQRPRRPKFQWNLLGEKSETGPLDLRPCHSLVLCTHSLSYQLGLTVILEKSTASGVTILSFYSPNGIYTPSPHAPPSHHAEGPLPPLTFVLLSDILLGFL